MAYIGGCPAFFEAQNCNGIEEELTKTIDASEDLPKLSKESFANLKEDLAKNDQECQNFVGGRIIDVVGGISGRVVRRIIRRILAKQGLLAQNVVVTSWSLQNPNPKIKFSFTGNFKSVQAASDFLKAVKNFLTVANSKTDEIRGIINGILGNIVADVVELGKEFDD